MGTLFTIIFTILGYVPLRLVQFWHRRLVCRRRSVWLELDVNTAKSFQQGTSAWQALEAMCDDDDLRTLVVTVHSLPVGWANIQAFRGVLQQVKDSGKTLFFHVFSPDMRALYLASLGDKVWLRPSGEVFWTGLGGRHTFYGALFERIGIKADIEAAGDYKSFGEPYTRSSASEANREQLLMLYGDLQAQYLEEMAASTKLSIEELMELSSCSPLDPDTLQKVGLIEGTMYRDQLQAKVKDFTSVEGESISFSFYERLRSWHKFWQRWGDIRPKIAVIHLNGAIVENVEQAPGIEAGEVVETLRTFAEMDSIKSVVLAVNSPGGSATASDRIAREVKNLQQKKPVVVHFGNVAASGGYYLSVPADEIIAQNGTITGSIGVVGGKLVIGEAFERYGVHGETIAVGSDTDMFDVWTPFNDSQRDRFKSFLQRTYQRFILVVSDGRTMPKEAVESVAQGRVWTGRQALERGLVDRLGSLRMAVQRAAERAGLNPRFIRVISWRKKISFVKRLQQRLLLASNPSLTALAMKEAPLLVQQVHERPLEPLMLIPVEIEYK